jgi:hypothetical protein
MSILYSIDDELKSLPISVSGMYYYIRNTIKSSDILVNIYGIVEIDIANIIKYENSKDHYSRRFNELYIFETLDSCVSFLNCDTNHSLFCVLFNGSLNNDTSKYYPEVMDFRNDGKTISFKILIKFDLDENDAISESFHYTEDFTITIISDESTNENLASFINRNEPCEHELQFNDLKINKNVIRYNKYKNKYSDNKFYRIPISSYDILESLKDTVILIHMLGESSSAHDTPKWDHNEYLCFKKMSDMKEFLEREGFEDYFYLLNEDMIGEISLISQNDLSCKIKINNDNDAYYDEYEITFIVKTPEMMRKVMKYVNKFIEE